MSGLSAVKAVGKLALKSTDEALTSFPKAKGANEFIDDVPMDEIQPIRSDDFVDTSPDIDMVPDVGVHKADDMPLVDHLKNHYGFSDIDPAVNGNSLRMYSEAMDMLADLLPIAKGTPPQVFSLRGRLSVMPFTKEAMGVKEVNQTTSGAFHNTAMGDNPRMFVRRPNGSTGEDFYKKIRVVQHEWFHALDDYLLTHFSDSFKWNQEAGSVSAQGNVLDIAEMGRMASADGAKMTGMRPELFEKWDRLRTAILTPADRGGRVNLASRMKANDPNQDYLGQNWEMMSRSFEQYLEVKDAAKFGEPPSLSRGVNYPYADEMKILEPLFDDFFAELKVKEAKTRTKRPIPTWYAAPPVAGAAALAGSEEAEAGIIDDIKARNAALEEAAGITQEEGAAEATPTVDALTDQERRDYAFSDYNSVAEFLAARK